MLRGMKENLRPLALAVLVGVSAGWWAHGSSVHAAAVTAPAQFQMSGDSTTLSIYYPGERMLYVYPAQSGADNTYCSYSFRIGAEGGPIQRENCPIGKLF
jgi:hypothetical protein